MSAQASKVHNMQKSQASQYASTTRMQQLYDSSPALCTICHIIKNKKFTVSDDINWVCDVCLYTRMYYLRKTDTTIGLTCEAKIRKALIDDSGVAEYNLVSHPVLNNESEFKDKCMRFIAKTQKVNERLNISGDHVKDLVEAKQKLAKAKQDLFKLLLPVLGLVLSAPVDAAKSPSAVVLCSFCKKLSVYADDADPEYGGICDLCLYANLYNSTYKYQITYVLMLCKDKMRAKTADLVLPLPPETKPRDGLGDIIYTTKATKASLNAACEEYLTNVEAANESILSRNRIFGYADQIKLNLY